MSIEPYLLLCIIFLMFKEDSTKLVRVNGVQVANSHSKRVTIGDRSRVISKNDSHSRYQKRIFNKTFLSQIVQSKRGETFKQREVKEHFEQSRRHHESNELNHFPSNDRKNQRNETGDLAMVDMLWSVLKRGKMLGHIEEEIREFEDPASYWSLLNEVMSEGELFVEIGGCRTAYRVAMDWRNRHSSIIALLFREMYTRVSHFYVLVSLLLYSLGPTWEPLGGLLGSASSPLYGR
uniref:Uncharacterized protein n=1 Tax=Octopus bimaculoides TaxID=37653 RepID=A0A0L8GAS2_OCTBM